MKAIQREDFLEQYSQAWKRVRLNTEPLKFQDEILEFSFDEACGALF